MKTTAITEADQEDWLVKHPSAIRLKNYAGPGFYMYDLETRDSLFTFEEPAYELSLISSRVIVREQQIIMYLRMGCNVRIDATYPVSPNYV